MQHIHHFLLSMSRHYTGNRGIYISWQHVNFLFTHLKKMTNIKRLILRTVLLTGIAPGGNTTERSLKKLDSRIYTTRSITRSGKVVF